MERRAEREELRRTEELLFKFTDFQPALLFRAYLGNTESDDFKHIF
jgi:hypothetical protein